MNWFKYRLPNTDPNSAVNTNPIVSGASDRLIHGLGKGFAIAPFLFPQKDLILIPLDFVPDPSDICPIYSPLPQSTPKEDYLKEVYSIISDLNGQRGKTVASRAITIDCTIDINATFNSLCKAFPSAFVFAFSTPLSGTWFGATPELLLSVHDAKVTSIALAGTRPASPDGEMKEWDKKNIDEQKMVQEFISDCLKEHCSDVECAPTFTRKAGGVEHICTPISGILSPSTSEPSPSTLHSLLASLSPTPAVCGSDRNRSLTIIERHERFHREMYGGFCGPVGISRQSEFFVILRSAKCSKREVTVFAGGGITSLSIPEEEWKETEMKSKTILHNLKTSEE